MTRSVCVVLSLVAFALHPAAANELRLVTFNTESDADTRPEKVGETMRSVRGADVWALQEVEDAAALRVYRDHAGDGDWRYVLSESGGEDRLAILYRTDRLRHVETLEYHAIRSRAKEGQAYGEPQWGLRGALFVRLHDAKSGRDFYVGNVHLQCCREGRAVRAHQAKLLSDRILQLTAPLLLVGDFNIPVRPSAARGNPNSEAFRTLVRTPLEWIRPVNPTTTQCDPQFDSMLDLVFRSPMYGPWSVTAEIQQPEASYCEKDAHGFADHRPVAVDFTLKPLPTPKAQRR